MVPSSKLRLLPRLPLVLAASLVAVLELPRSTDIDHGFRRYGQGNTSRSELNIIRFRRLSQCLRQCHFSNHWLTIVVDASCEGLNGIIVEFVARRPVQCRRLPWPELHDRVIEGFKWGQCAIDKRNEYLKYYTDYREGDAPSNYGVLAGFIIAVA
jgi:hypothetical protein